VLLAGFAAADAIRGRAGERSISTPTSGVQTTPTRLPGPQPQASAPPGWPQGELQGTLVFTNAGDCRVRVIGLGGGVERPEARFGGNCQLWAAPVGQRFAYGLGPSSPDGLTPFRVADLEHPNHELGGFRALFGVVIWSLDGQRVAWCGRRHTGFDLEVGGPARRLPRCPIAYTPGDRVAWTIGNRLYVEGRVVLRANGGITFAHYGTDGSLAIVEDGLQILRYDPRGRLTGAFPTVQGETPILSPDNCAAVFRPFGGFERITFIPLGCFRGRTPTALVGRDAAWSPDGKWLAVAERDNVAFQRLVGPARTIRWPAAAVQLAWRVR
jgi:WD40-like Beta Propeller Repeat